MSIKSGIVRGVVAALLVVAGWICWTAGALQAQLAEANGQMIMLRYQDSLAQYDDIEESVGLAARVPARVTQGFDEVGEKRATALYWDRSYDALSLARDASGELVETNPEILFMAANAAYRAGVGPGGDQTAAVRALDEAVANYAEVLRKVPGHADAAYNYEYAVRARAAATSVAQAPRGRAPQAPAAPEPDQAAAAAGAARYDLPAGSTIHGQPGAPPEASDNSKFKMLVPMRPDERPGTPERAGEGARPVRRG